MRPARDLACAALLAFGACGGDDPLRAVSDTAQSVLQSARDAIDAARAFTQDHKAEVQATLEEKFRKLSEGIQALRGRIAQAGRKARPEWQSALAGLQEKKSVVRDKILELRDAGERGWDRLKPQIELALDELEKAYLRFKAQFK
jgi:hypothetical protein